MYKLVDRKEVRRKRKIHFWRQHKTQIGKARLCVFRSARHIQAQLIDDLSHKVIVAASSMEKDLRGAKLNGKDMAKKIGELIAQRATKAGVKDVVFDRNGFAYHGRISSLADAARSAGLKF